jgi:hypothetical protein
MSFCAILLLLVVATPSWGKDVEAFPGLDLNNAHALKEAARVLDEELKLASRPQTYLLIDLVENAIHIKGRGIGLHHIPIIEWSADSREELKGIHRLVERPPVVRRKIAPGAADEQEPISLADMPADYVLIFTPHLTVVVAPSVTDQNVLQSVGFLGKSWWRKVKNWGSGLFAEKSSSSEPQLELKISVDDARSVAWTLVDGMALVVRRPAEK